MKAFTNIAGILLIILGIVGLAYQGFSYTQREKVLQIGELQVTAETEKHIYFPPLASGLAVVVGIVLVIVARKK